MTRWALVFVATSFSACGSAAPSPSTAELNLGVDMRAEASDTVASLERVGYEVVSRLDAERFVAIEMRRGDAQSLVRVFTSRGAAYAVEGDSEALPPTPRVSLLLPDVGVERLRASSDVVVGVRDDTFERTCLHILSIRDDDSVLEVPLRLLDLPTDVCVEQLRDVDNDGTLEALVVWREYSLARSDTPVVVIPLTRDAGTGGLTASRVAFAAVFDGRLVQLRNELDEARAHLNLETMYTRAVELAMLRWFRTGSRDAAVTEFDEAMSGVVLSESVARSVEDARAAFARGMTDPGSSDRQPSHVESGRP